MSISSSDQKLLEYNLAKFLYQEKDIKFNLDVYKKKFGTYFPVLRKGKLIIPILFFEGRKIREFLKTQNEYKNQNIELLVETSMGLVEVL